MAPRQGDPSVSLAGVHPRTRGESPPSFPGSRPPPTVPRGVSHSPLPVRYSSRTRPPSAPVDVEFEQLFHQVYPSLLRYCHRLAGDPDVAEDMAQEAFVRLHRNGVTGPVPALRVWLFRVATRLIQDRGRAVRNRARLLEENPVLPWEAPDPEEGVERSRTVGRVRQILERLDGRDRELLLMREEGFSYREMAEVVGVAPGSIGTLLARAQRRFTTMFEKEGGP